MPHNDQTGFDAFFRAVTTSPEFKSAMTKDWKWDSIEAFETSLRQMESGVAKATDIMKEFDTKFATDEAKNAGKNFYGWDTSGATPPKTGNPKTEDDIPPLKIEHFQKQEGKPWGFEAVAGMDSLKDELRDSFIKPLKFKFLIEKLKKESETSVIARNSSTSMTNDVEIQVPENTEHGLLRSSQWQKQQELLLRLYAEYERFKISIPTGMLFYGPPGTGKTFITKKLAEELGCGFLAKNMGEFGSSYLHQTTKNIKDFFAGAKKAAENEPILMFLDEIDSLVSARTNNVDANKAEEVSQFLQEFNALESAPNLIVIAATNRPDHLDSAILRSGRLDKKIYLGPPDGTARKALFQMYIEKMGRPHETLDYDELTVLTKDYVSADIEAICDEVARDASRNLLELVDEATNGTLTETHLEWHTITMDSLRKTIAETPSSLKMVDMSVYESWLEKIQ